MTKVYILGTSNSVMGLSGFIEALSIGCDVINRSAGRNTIFYHIHQIIEDRLLIESCDYLIIDHYVNDSFFYKDILGNKYEYYLELFYSLISSLNVRVVNIMFPIIGKFNKDVRWIVRDFCQRFSVSYIDMNELPFRGEHYRDSLHISKISSYMLGVFLLSEISGDRSDRPTGGKVEKLPIRLLAGPELFPDSEVAHFSNRTCSIRYVKLKERTIIPLLGGEKIASIGYFREMGASVNHGFSFNGAEFAVNPQDYGFFHELVDESVSGCSQIEPVVGSRVDAVILAARGTISGQFGAPNLVSLLCVDTSSVLDVTPASRSAIEFDLARLVTAIDSVQKKCMPPLSYASVDKIRDLALAWESKDLNIAAELMQLALHYRPTGPFIKNKAAEYSEQIKNQKTS